MERIHVHDGDEATESKFYVPAGSTLPLVTSWLERVWRTLSDHGVGASRPR
jgi:hypothetical protein